MKSLQEKLDAAQKECDHLRTENRNLKELIHQAQTLPCSKTEPETPTAGSNLTAINNESPADAKVALFRSLFRGREDIYPVRWESKKGRLVVLQPAGTSGIVHSVTSPE